MKIAILGYGKEGKSVEQYFRQNPHALGLSNAPEIQIFDDFSTTDLNKIDFSHFDLVFRSPSVHPPKQVIKQVIQKTANRAKDETQTNSTSPNSYQNWSSITKFFFAHCPCPIIGITGTKGKGTTCTMLRDILEKLGQKVWLVGNIGNPALDILDQASADDIVIYEMSSFQLWDLTQSPHVAIILKVEPDHLNVHDNFEDYVNAKANITKWQNPKDFCIYYQNNPNTAEIAKLSPAQKIGFPITRERKILEGLLDNLQVAGQHNREDAEAALLAAACYHNMTLSDFIQKYHTPLSEALHNFHGLPHRLEFLRKLNGVKYYDDNFSTNLASTSVALEAFPAQPIIHIVGGRDKTNGANLPEIAQQIIEKTTKAVLIGESGHELAKILPSEKFEIANTLSEAVNKAQELAEKIQKSDNRSTPIVLMSPAAASFDMFENVYDRGAQFQKLVQELK